MQVKAENLTKSNNLEFFSILHTFIPTMDSFRKHTCFYLFLTTLVANPVPVIYLHLNDCGTVQMFYLLNCILKFDKAKRLKNSNSN